MATNTAATFTNLSGNNTAGPFNISFPYLSEAEVDVTVGGFLKTLGTHYTFTSASQITFTSGNEPANGVAIKFQRNTNISSRKVDFEDGSVLTEIDLDTNSNQLIHALQEITDGVISQPTVATSDTSTSVINPPANPSNGDLWWNNEDGDLHIYYDDGNSQQWVSVTGAGSGSGSSTGTQYYTPSFTNAVNRLINTRLEDTVNANDFGTKGDGTTDDTAALQNAISYCIASGGRELVINAGVYLITTEITATIDAQLEQLHIRGAGNVILKCVPAATLTAFLNISITSNHYASGYSTGAPRCSIKNIEFAYANETTTALSSALTISGSNITGLHTQMFVIEDCQFVPWTNTPNSTLFDTFFSIAVVIDQLHEVSFRNCTFYGEHDQNAVGTLGQQGYLVSIVNGTPDASHHVTDYYFDSCTFLYGMIGLFAGPYVQGINVNNCTFMQSHYGIYIEGQMAGEDPTDYLSGGLRVTNSVFDNEIKQLEPSTATDTMNSDYNIFVNGYLDIKLSNNYFSSGRDLASNPPGARVRGCIYINNGGRFNINGNNFASKGKGANNSDIYQYSNYYNTAITIENTNLSSTNVDSQIQANNFYDFAGSRGAIYLAASSKEIQCYQELNVFQKSSGSVNILNQGTNNITTLIGVSGINSDYRIKKDITTQTESGISKVKQLRPVNYKFKDNVELNFIGKEDNTNREGFIAHEIAEVIPSGVQGNKDALNKIQTINVDAVLSVLTKALQEAISKIEILESEIASLKDS